MNITVEQLGPVASPADLDRLANLVLDVIEGGASIGWTSAPTYEEAASWWDHHLAGEGVMVWVARNQSGDVLGTVSLGTTWKPNSKHRAEVMKLMVPRSSRGLGISSLLMREVELFARQRGISLLVLDTEQGSLAESLYRKWGWEPYGVIPDYVTGPAGEYLPCIFMLKRLAADPV